MNLTHPLAALLVTATLFGPSAWAGEGHDHSEASSPAVEQALPRFAAVSETFELVGVLSGQQITLYLDRFGDNSPVREAQIELDIDGTKYKAEKRGADEYAVMLHEAPVEGVLPVTAKVTAGVELDLLAGELDIHPASHGDDAVHTPAWSAYAAWGTGGLAALALLAWSGGRVMRRRSLRAASAA
ncbi:hypothetical protein [Ideonella sp.]|jgi:hypothetical protein|uniref:hypothetical protein n=1 Tax=Ideonella sp. TaxID=1929293 RepID=UPI0037BE8F86